MAPVIVGESVQLDLTTAETVEGTPSVSVLLPDGSEVAPPVAGSGPWLATFTTSQPGRHVVTWIFDSGRTVDVLDVWPEDPRYLVSMDDAVAAVTSGGGAPASTRAQLPVFVAAATEVVESLTGPLVPQTRTAKRDGGRPAVVLPVERVTVVSVSVNGTALAEADYVVDEDAGVVHAASGWFAGGHPLGVVVEYRVGTATIPANVRLAVLELIAYLWATSRQGARAVDSDTLLTPSGFAVPRRVAELCAATHAPAPGFA